jgi:ParE toxin of type II toxin-antitoxin system, parDE
VAEQLHNVELTDSFIERLASIEAFLEEADAALAYDDLLAGLRGTVIPNLARFPLIGKRYLDQPPQSAEALTQLAQLPQGAADALRVYLHSDYLILYAVDAVDAVKLTVYLLSLRHHHQLSFNFARLWPGA